MARTHCPETQTRGADVDVGNRSFMVDSATADGQNRRFEDLYSGAATPGQVSVDI